MASPEIPDKFYFKIGEVSGILGVEPYVVRFWETQFRLHPAKNSSRHRIYKRQDVETLMEIRRLLYEEKYTIEGAQKRLKERMKEHHRQLALELKENPYKSLLKRVKKDLRQIRDILGRQP